MFFLRFFISAAAAIAASALFWAWLGKPVDLPDVPQGRLQCLSYTPHVDGVGDPRNKNTFQVPVTVLEQDMVRFAPITACLRVYSALGPTPDIVAAAQRHGIRIILGAWLSSDADDNALEIASALRIAREYPDTVRMLVVGNEVLLRREMSPEQLMATIREVRAHTSVPVAYAEVSEFWEKNPQVADTVDMILVHLLPYWGDPAPSIEQAQQNLNDDLGEFRALFPGKPMMIGETGWPSAGPDRYAAVASVVNEARYVREFIRRVSELGIEYNLIEALDQPWKRIDEGTVGGYWGILDIHRQAKFPLTGPVSEWPHWPQALGIASLIGLGVAVLFLRTRPAGWRLVLLAFGSQALGSLLVMQWRYVQETSQTWPQWTFGIGTLLLSLATGLVLADRLEQGAHSRFSATPAPLSDLFRWLRKPWQQPLTASLGLALVQFAAAFPVTCVSLAFALSPRHRDIPGLLFVTPALLALLLLRSTPPQERRREEAWLALILCGSALFCFNGPNRQAMAWMATAIVLSLPWLAYTGREFLALGHSRGQARPGHQPS